MEKFINKKKKQYIGYMIAFIVFFVIAMVSQFLVTAGILVPKNYGSNPIFTACMAWSIVSLCYSIDAKRLLKNEEKLKKAYIKETDERTLLIEKNATVLTCKISVFILCIAFIIFGFIDEKIYNAMFAVIGIELTIYLLCKFICNKKY